MSKYKLKLTAIFSVLLLTMVLGLCGCGNNSGDVSAARRGMEDSAAKKLRDKFADEDVTEIVVDDDVTVMGCLVINGEKTISGTGTITLDTRAKAGIYQDASVLEDGKTLTEEDLAQMMESSVVYVNKGAKLNLAGEVVIDSNMSGNGVVVAEGGSVVISEKASLVNGNLCSLYNQGEVSLEGGTLSGANGYIIINDGTLTVKNGEMDASKAMGNIYNLDSLTVSGGVIGKATVNNIYVADGSAVFNGGSVTGGKKTNVYVAEAATAEVQKNAVIQSGTTGIANHGKLKLKEAKIERNLTQIQNYGTADIDKSELLTASVDHIVNEETGTVNLTDTNLTSAGARAIANNKGTVNFKNLGVRRTGGNAICNNGGTISGEDIVIYGASGTAIDNMDAIDALGGNVTIKGVEIQTGNGMNIVQQSGGKMELTDVISGITTVTNIKVISGELVLNGLEIQGTTSTGAGIWTIGGKVEVNDALIKSTKGRGMALNGGEITGNNLKFEDIVNTGIAVQTHTNLYTSAKAVLSNVSFSGGGRDNVSTEGPLSELTITGGNFGKTTGNNVRVKDGKMTLNNVNVLGNETPSETDYHCVYQYGGELTLNNCTLKDPIACAINNKGGNINATNLKVYNTPAVAIRNAASDGKYGNITIDGLKTYNTALGSVKNECKGTLTVINGDLCESTANIAMVKEGKMVLKNTTVHRAIKTEDNFHNTYITGGTLELINVVLQDSDASGIRQTGGTVIGDNVTIKNAKTNNVNISNGKTTLKNSTLEVSKRTNVNLNIDTKVENAKAEIVLTNTKVNGAGNLTGDTVSCIYLGYNATATLDGGTVVRDSAASHGITLERGTLYAKDATITGNAALGIHCKAGTIHLDGTTVTNNKTRGINLAKFDTKDKDGNAITYYATAPSTIKNAVISDNGNGSVSGGGIYCEQGALTVADSTISGNTAHTGGGINCGSNSNVTLKNVTIKNNKAIVYGTNAGNGGGIHVSGTSQCNIYGGNITGNTAAGKANGIRVNDDFGMYDGAVVDSNNEVYLEAGRTIKTTANGIGNKADNPMKIVTANTTTGTILVEAGSEQEAARANGAVACYNTEGTLVSTTDFEQNVIVGVPGQVAWVARTQSTDGSWTKYLSLQAAIDAVPQNGVLTRVEVISDMTLSGAIDIAADGNRNILLTDDGNGPYTITRGFGGAQMIILRKGNQLTLEGTSKDDTAPSLIIDGAEYATAGSQQMIMVGTSTSNWDATFTMNAGVALKNNNCNGGGGALLVYGKVYMNGGLIHNNESTGDNGGAIYIQPTGSMTIIGGTISKNSCTSVNGSNQLNKDGGAIYITAGGSLTMSGGTITGNSAQAGGAILTYGTVTMTGGTISNNTARTNGGAIFAHSKSRFEMEGGSITGNTANGNGGAVYLHYNATNGVGTMTMSAGTISDNTAVNGGGVGMAHATNTLTMTGGSITDNTAAGKGSDIHVVGTLNMGGTSTADSIYLETGKTVNLTAVLSDRQIITELVLPTYTDGTKVISGNADIVAVDYVKFAVPDGTGVEIDEEGCLVSTAAPIDYEAQILQSDGSYVGYMTLAEALAAVPTDGVQTRVELMKNITLTASLDIPADGNRNILLTDDGNGPYTITRGFGGAQIIILRKGNQLTLEGTSKDDTAPSLIIDGAEYATAGSQQMIMVGTSTSNWNATLTMNAGVALKNNNCKGGGGALLVYGKVYMNGGLIHNNESTGDHGGAIYIQSTGSMTMTGGTISKNSCTSVNTSKQLNKDGGAIYVAAGGSLTMSGGTITGNSAQAGGAILTYGSMTMTGGTISDNTSRTNGGAIFLHIKVLFTMQGGSITGNTAGGNGGAVYLHQNSSGLATMTMSGGTISGNKAVNGGGVGMAHATNALTMTGGSIVENTATGLGNDIYVKGTLNMAGAAVADSIYLETGKTVNLTAALSDRQKTTEIVLPEYTVGTEVISGDASVITDSYQYFKSSEEGYTINSEGKLEEEQNVLKALLNMVRGVLQ